MSGMGQLSQLAVRGVPFTPKSDQTGVKVKFKVFWKTTKFWTQADVIDFQNNVSRLAEKLKDIQYWDKEGKIHSNKFTCEDFAVRMLCEYASSKGLPVKLTTDVRTYRNMEIYSASQHDHYVSNMYGFAEMVMLTYGAPDMQRIGVNTVAVKQEELLPGDILAQAYDRKNALAHHIQIVTKPTVDTIYIMQGNSSGVIIRPFTTVMRLLQLNRADPQNINYAGMTLQTGVYKKTADGWNYKNTSTGHSESNFLKMFQYYRWNFLEFNK